MIIKRERRFLRTVEWLGNALPHPVILFIILTISLIVVSMIGQYFNISAPDPRPPGAKGRNDDGIIYIVSLLVQMEFVKFFRIWLLILRDLHHWALFWFLFLVLVLQNGPG